MQLQKKYDMSETKVFKSDNIYLVGYRCAGKSGAGSKLAKRLSRNFVDTDEMIEKKAGMPVSGIVSAFGWERFREMEADILREISGHCGLVVATGGGIVTNPANIGIMRKTGVVVWLCASVATIISRMTADLQTQTLRPALSDAPLEKEVRQTLAQRFFMYEKAADFSLNTDKLDITETCDAIFGLIRSADARKFIRKDV